MTPVRKSLRVLLVAATLLVSPLAWGAEAGNFVKAKQDQLVVLLKKPDSAATQRQIEGLFDQMLDYDALAVQSLGEHWAGRTAEEQKDFKEILQQLVRNSYRKNLKKTLGYEVTFSGEKPVEQGVLVKSVARSRSDKREEPVSVEYVLHRVGGDWRVKDIVTEGSSLVKNYRQQFNRIIKKSGFAELLRRMKSKLSES